MPVATTTMNADGSGSGSWDGYDFTFIWSTNEGWLLSYDGEYEEPVGIAYVYSVDGSTMTLRYNEEDDAAGVQIIETWTKQ